MNKRLALLESLVASDKADSFALYGLAMEYRKEGRADDSVATFEKLKERDPDYVPMYLMAGQLLLDEERPAEARVWLEAGIRVATKKGDMKAKSELSSALGTVDD